MPRSRPLPRSTALDRWRQRIDALDAELLALLARRSRLSVRVAHWKRRTGLPLRTPVRESLILARAKRTAPAPLTAGAAERIFRTILAEMRALQLRHAGRR
jgi:chorismate mutase